MSVISENSAPSPSALLDVIRRRPGMFWGNSDYPFTSLVAFLSGHHCGFAATHRGQRMVPDELIPEGFPKFVSERFGRPYPDSGRGWQTIIQENAASQREAFDMFFRLRDEFVRLADSATTGD